MDARRRRSLSLTPVSADLTESVNIQLLRPRIEILESLEASGVAGQVASTEKSNVQTEVIEEEMVNVAEEVVKGVTNVSGEEGVSKDVQELSRPAWLSESLTNSG